MERTSYRIIDANFNRAREAIRVTEDFCRFSLNSESLALRAKELRHLLCTAVGRLDCGKLISSRDTADDVGIGKTVVSQLHRTGVRDCFLAACKRLTEALRVLAEMIQPIDTEIANKIEQLRYAAYTLERDVTLFSDTSERFKGVGLYIIITDERPMDIISLTKKCIAGGADCIQLRVKTMDDDKFLAAAEGFVQVCRSGNVLSIINDRVDIAVAAGADGVHLGQNDLPAAVARKLQMTPLIIGKTTHSLQQLASACAEMPTYVSLGPVFATATKPDIKAVGIEYVEKAAEILTCIRGVAIGGINADNIEKVLAAGAAAVAVSSAVTNAADPAYACRAIKEIMNTAKKPLF